MHESGKIQTLGNKPRYRAIGGTKVKPKKLAIKDQNTIWELAPDLYFVQLLSVRCLLERLFLGVLKEDLFYFSLK